MKTSKQIISVLAIAALPAIAGCGTGEASVVAAEETVSTPVPVEVAYAANADIYATYDATSTIGSEGDAPVLARVGGEVVELLVEEGDWVEQGDALARLDGERLRLEMLAAKADLDKARGEYRRYTDLHERGLVSKSMFDGLRFDLEGLEATYELRKLNFGYTRIRAPISGYVSTRKIKLGQSIVESEEAFRVTDTNQLVAYLQIPQAELEKFAAGHEATLEVDAMPGFEFPATIARISPTIDTRNGTFRATAIIDNGDAQLAPGMFARFTIAYEKHDGALVIPARAVVKEDEQTSVYVVSNGEVSRRSIELGIRSGDQVEVLGGLDHNEQIVVVGHSALRDGSKVLAANNEANSFTG